MSPSHGNRNGADAGGASRKGPSGPVGKEAIDAALKKQQQDQQQSRGAKKPTPTTGPSKQSTSPTHRPTPDTKTHKGSSQAAVKKADAPRGGKHAAAPGKPTASSLSTGANTRPPAPKKAAFTESYTQTRVQQAGTAASSSSRMVFEPKKPADSVITSDLAPGTAAKKPAVSASARSAGTHATPTDGTRPQATTPKAEVTKPSSPPATQPQATTPKAEVTKPSIPPATQPQATTPKTALGAAPNAPVKGHTSHSVPSLAEDARGVNDPEVSSDLRPADPPRPAPNKQIKITEKTINKIVGQAIRSVPGVITVDGGMEKVTGRNYPRYDLALDDDGDAVSVNAQIAVGWPAPVAEVAQKVRETIITWVSDMTDVPVSHAHVTVGLVEPGHERTTPTQLAAFNPHPVLTPITVNSVEPTVSVVTDSINDSVRSIPVPKPAALMAFSAGNAPEITQPTVTPRVTVSSPTVSEPLQLTDIEVAESPELTPITVQDPIALKPIVTHDATGDLTAITVRDSATLSTVQVASFGDLTPVTVADEKPLVPVSQKPCLPEVPVTIADAKPLAKVTTRTSELAEITVSPTPLTEVRQPAPVSVSRVVPPTGHRLADVTPPTPMRLAEIVTDRKPLARVQDPTPHRLAKVSVPDDRRVARPKAPQATRLKRIITKGMRVQETPRVDATPVRKTGVPDERPLRPIVVRSPELKTIKVVTEK